MTVHFVKETAATSKDDVALKTDENASTNPLSSEAEEASARPGLLLAGLVLLAALSAPSGLGTVPIESYTGRKRYETVAESATTDVECDSELVEQVRELFERGASEFFQDGMHSAFSRGLLALLAQQGRKAFRAIGEYVFSLGTNPDVVSEALRWLADFEDPATLPMRWVILQRALRDRSPRVRDGAILGFAALDDPRARSLLLTAQELEPVAELQRLIGQVVKQLSAKHVPAAPHGSRESLA